MNKPLYCRFCPMERGRIVGNYTEEHYNTISPAGLRNGKCVYVFNMGLYYKIGVTTSLKSRLSQFSGYPDKVTLVLSRYCKEPFAVEKKLHFLFKHKRCGGEWFKLDNEDLTFIEQYLMKRRYSEAQDEK